jgi:anti-anti-sigma regulatory factor
MVLVTPTPSSSLPTGMPVRPSLDQHPVTTLVLQPMGHLSQDRASSFQVTLTEALQQANSVVIDFLWVTAVAADGLAVLLAGLQFAESLGKDLSFYSADADTYAVLQAQRYQRRSLSLDQGTVVCQPGFSEFLSRRGHTSTDTTEQAPLPKPKPLVQPTRPQPVVLSAAPYTPTTWHSNHVAS